jgi:hypothetical protein
MPRHGETAEETMARNGFVCLGPPVQQEPWVPAESRVRRDDWRTMKDEFFKAKIERDGSRRD